MDRPERRGESLVEQRIREAREEGAFDDLPGNGRPQDLSENPFVDPTWRLAYRMLKNAGLAPSFITERREIVGAVDAARRRLDAGRDERRFEADLNRLNDRIGGFNDGLPSATAVYGATTTPAALQMHSLSFEAELGASARRRARGEDSSGR
jgi:DnaJ family protein C protein 28